MVHFQLSLLDPQLSINQMFSAAPDYQGGSHREGYEPVGPHEEEKGEKREGGQGRGQSSPRARTTLGGLGAQQVAHVHVPVTKPLRF